MGKDYTITELIVGLGSLFIFFYRSFFIMIPMMSNSFYQKDLGKFFKASTLLI